MTSHLLPITRKNTDTHWTCGDMTFLGANYVFNAETSFDGYYTQKLFYRNGAILTYLASPKSLAHALLIAERHAASEDHASVKHALACFAALQDTHRPARFWTRRKYEKAIRAYEEAHGVSIAAEIVRAENHVTGRYSA